MSDAIIVKSLTPADRDALLEVDQAAFGFDTRHLDPEADTAWIEWDRAFGGWRGDSLAGAYVVFSYGLSVPARPPEVATVIPMAGLSWVAVHPDERRRGVLRSMIRHHLDSVHESGRGETISGLFASESRIYGRFGYGISTQSNRLTLPAQTALRKPRDTGAVTTRFVAARPETHDRIVKRVYDAECLRRPGHTARPRVQWLRHLDDPMERRPAGTESLKIVVAERVGQPTGYAVLRRKQAWSDHAPDGEVHVGDLQAIDTQSAYALWRRVLDFDLMARVTTPGLPADHPLMTWASESGVTSQPGHSFWTRVVDLAGALAARGYAHPVDVVLDVTDELCPWNAGRWRLAADTHGSTCTTTTAPADLALDIREVGSAFLGGTTLQALGDAGLVDELTPGALTRCSLAWRSPVLPATPYMF